jgi:hypothetical protein
VPPRRACAVEFDIAGDQVGGRCKRLGRFPDGQGAGFGKALLAGLGQFQQSLVDRQVFGPCGLDLLVQLLLFGEETSLS